MIQKHEKIGKIIVILLIILAIVVEGIVAFDEEVLPRYLVSSTVERLLEGTELQVDIISSYIEEPESIPGISIQDDGMINVVVEEHIIEKLILVLGTFLMGICFYITYICSKILGDESKNKRLRKVKKKKSHNEEWYLGTLFVCTSLWILLESSVPTILTGRPESMAYIAMILVQVIPILYLRFIRENSVNHHSIYLILERIFYVYAGLVTILFPIFGESVVTTNIAHSGTVVILCMICLYLIGKDIVHEWNSNTKEVDKVIAFSIIIVVGMLVDACAYLTTAYSIVGIGTGVGLLAYGLIYFVLIRIENMKMNEKKYQLEEEIEQMQSIILLRQIKAHFLYNTLNSISVLCKQDPKEADRAVKLFASYMRSNMNLIVQSELIAFDRELELIHSYTEIEKIRFQEHLNIQMDLQFRNFKIPALSIQPIVENAILHGIGQKRGGGTVLIETKELADDNGRFALITIQDDGVGMELEQLNKGDSLGLKNIQNRLYMMANATVDVVSEKGVGTTIKVKIPL